MLYYDYGTIPWYDLSTEIVSVTVDGVTSISGYAFAGCTSLKTVSILNKLTTIDENAFMDCGVLESFTIPGGVISIGNNAFCQCYKLKSITFTNILTYIGECAFMSCIELESLTIPESVTYIGNSVFSGCTLLKSIVIPNSVTKMGNEVFCNCHFLTSVVISNKLTSIGSAVFMNCELLKSIVIPDSITSIGDYAFSYCKSIKAIKIPENVKSIGVEAFSNCESLISVEIPINLRISSTSSTSDPFFLNNELIVLYLTGSGPSKNYTKAETTTSRWFNLLSGFRNIVIQEGITSIGNYIFYNLPNLQSIFIPETVTSIGLNAFDPASSLVNLVYAGLNAPTCKTVYSNSQFIVIVQNSYTSSSFCSKNVLKKFEGTCGDTCYWKVDSSMTQIEISGSGIMDDFNYDQFWFVFMYVLKNAIIEGVTSIGVAAFQQCISLESVTLLNCVNSIGNSAFSYCSSLGSISFSNSVTSIGDYAFYYSTSLKSMKSGSVHYFGSSSFYGTGIETVIIGNENDERVYIGQNAFENCKNLKSVTLKPRFKSHQNDTSLKSCSIQKNAFANCPNIESFIIDGYVDEVKEYAFSFNEINNVSFHYHSVSSPQICSSLDPNNNTMLLPIFSNNAYLINVSKGYQSNVFCSCDKCGCPIIYIENKEYENIQNVSVLIEKTLDELPCESSENEDESTSDGQSESSNEGDLNENSSNESDSYSSEVENSGNKNDDQNKSSSNNSENEPKESSSNKSSENELNESENDENKAITNAFTMAFLLILTII